MRTVAPLGAAAKVLRWRHVFNGEERQLGVLRRWLASLLPECPARDDVISVATELASNALRHTTSGRGGSFGVEITRDRYAVRVAVADDGGPAEPHVIEDPVAEHGRGLVLVRGLSVRSGVVGDRRGRLSWADVPWVDATETGPALLDPYEASIRDGEAALKRRFAGVHAWFGRSTLAWWALTGPDELVTAPSARELAGLLYRLQNASLRPRPAAAPQTRTHTVEQAKHRPEREPGLPCSVLGRGGHARLGTAVGPVGSRPHARGVLAGGGC
ncbi:MAG TPA: ATP-binding protein [Streptosporangiaceae bacterium]